VGTIDNSGGQTGDQHIGQAAGGDIHNVGADADGVLSFLREYVFRADQNREMAIKELRRDLERARQDREILSDAVRTIRDRVDYLVAERARDMADRHARQRRQDLWLGTLSAATLIMAGGWLWLLWRLWPTLTAIAQAVR
jgi:hypothetical protein